MMTPPRRSADFTKMDKKAFLNVIQIFFLFISTIRFCFD